MLYNNLKIFNNFNYMCDYANITNNLYKYSELYYISICFGVIFCAIKSKSLSNLIKIYHNNSSDYQNSSSNINQQGLENNKLIKKINIYKKKKINSKFNSYIIEYKSYNDKKTSSDLSSEDEDYGHFIYL
jgi:hypothetical protein